MVYASPAPGLYVLNDVFVDGGAEFPYPLLMVNGDMIYVAIKDANNYWRYDKDNDVIITDSTDGMDADLLLTTYIDRYGINLDHDDNYRIDAVTKSDVIGRVG
jgi:hypothetical protein